MELLTIAEAATRVGVSSRTIYRWIADGSLAATEGPGGVRIDGSSLAALQPPTRRRTPATSGDVRLHVLAAAMAILGDRARGHAALTIEQVATEAGMSVGGVTYHFPTKAALVDGLVDAFLDGFEDEWTSLRRDGASAADAYIAASLDGRREHRARAILLAALEYPATMRRIDARVKRWYREVEREASDPDADVRRCLAADALWLFDLLALRPVVPGRVASSVRGGGHPGPGVRPASARKPTRRSS